MTRPRRLGLAVSAAFALTAPQAPAADALEGVPPSAELAGVLKSHLVAHADELVGETASVKVGRARPLPAKLISVGESGVRAEDKGLEIDASWERLGTEGVYLLAGSFTADAPAEVHAAYLLLGLRLGRQGDPGFDEELLALRRKDAAAAREVEAALEKVTEARRAKRAQVASWLTRKREVRRSPYEQVATTASKPLRLHGRRGEVVSALCITTDPSDDRPAVEIRDCEDLTIQYCEIGPAKRAFQVSGSRNVKIVNCYIHDTANQPGVNAYKCDGLLVQGNRIERVSSGVFALECTGVKVIGNYVENVQGPMPRGQLAQFDKVHGEGNEVRGNYGVNYRGESRPEDMVNIYKSTGTAVSPILVEGNYLVGDPHHGSEDKSQSGSGCMLGDGGGRYITCRRNVCIAPGQVGIGVCGGSDIVVEENLILGTQSNVANVGMYVWDISKSSGSNITLRRNTVAWKSKTGAQSHFWKADPTGFTNVTIEDNDLGNWGHFKKSFPMPPSPAPMPPVPWGESRFPWDAEEACAEKAKKMAGP